MARKHFEVETKDIFMRRFRKKVSIAKQTKTNSEAELCLFR